MKTMTVDAMDRNGKIVMHGSFDDVYPLAREYNSRAAHLTNWGCGQLGICRSSAGK
jgi:hypothetical protein